MPTRLPAPPEPAPEPFAVVVRRRLVGLLVLLIAGYSLSLVLRRAPSERPVADSLETIVVPLGGSGPASGDDDAEDAPRRRE